MRKFNLYISERGWTRTSMTLWVVGLLAAGVTFWSDGTVQDVSAIAMMTCWGLYGAGIVTGFRRWKQEGR